MRCLTVLLVVLCPLCTLTVGCAHNGTANGTPLPHPAIATGTTPSNTPTFFIATPAPSKAVVTGTLLRWGSTGSVPEAELYLASIVTASDNDDFRLIALEPDSDPRAEMDALTGTFVFTDVEPALYAVAIVSPAGSTPINSPADGNALTFSVVAGEILDLGVIHAPAGW